MTLADVVRFATAGSKALPSRRLSAIPTDRKSFKPPGFPSRERPRETARPTIEGVQRRPADQSPSRAQEAIDEFILRITGFEVQALCLQYHTMTAEQILEQQFFEMRWRVLSLAADFDRIQRARNNGALPDDPRLSQLRAALGVVSSADHDRAARVQLIFSDQTPGPR
jgi:hypothetical protein